MQLKYQSLEEDYNSLSDEFSKFRDLFQKEKQLQHDLEEKLLEVTHNYEQL